MITFARYINRAVDEQNLNALLELNPFCLKFCTQTSEVKVQADYIVAE